MRYRRVKGATEKLEVLSRYITSDSVSFKGRWNEAFGNDNPIYLEMGCGKGKFIIEQAERNPEKNYIGVEGQEPVLLRAAQNAKAAGISNLTFISEFLRHPDDYFDRDEISGIYLNFSDPWPKARHAKRRLTHSGFLNAYRKFVKEDGFIAFKTDNDELFEFSVDEFLENRFSVYELSYNLHGSIIRAGEVTTEYEDKFQQWGKKIKYIKVGINCVK